MALLPDNCVPTMSAPERKVKTPPKDIEGPAVPMDYALWSLVCAKGREIEFSGIYRRYDGACVCNGDKVSAIKSVEWTHDANKATIIAEDGQELSLTWKNGNWYSSGHGTMVIKFSSPDPAPKMSDELKKLLEEAKKSTELMGKLGETARAHSTTKDEKENQVFNFALFPVEYQPSVSMFPRAGELKHISFRGVEKVANLLKDGITRTSGELIEAALKCDVWITSSHYGDF